MELVDGKKIANNILLSVESGVRQLPFQPIFCDLLASSDPASVQYVKMKAQAAEKVGMKFRPANYPESIQTEELIAEIKKISQEKNMKGLIVQLPLPSHIDRQAVLDAIAPEIDVDCTGKINSDLFYSGNAEIMFPTAAAVMEALTRTGQDFKNKKFVVLGRGLLVGKPVEFLLKQNNYIYQVIHSKTENPDQILKSADVIISAVGKPKFINSSMIKPGVLIIDAGTSESDGGLVGDVDFLSMLNIPGQIFPVPGGIGPITVAKLLENVLTMSRK
jgi:methylenetetrahydrofolate dehydrogenase (NADP+)/methenyltetrahydrofolate cyclohydrolase